jgi:iron(III) transport system substrate-binding protein
MKNLLIIIACLVGTAAASAQTTIKWVGQLPSEQAGPVVELFNTKYAKDYGFKVEYNYDDKVVAALLKGTVDERYDMVHMKDADMLNVLGEKSMSTPLNIEATRAWPMQMKDTAHRWVALLKRMRIIYYNSDLVTADEVKTYEALGDAKFKDQLCIRQRIAQYTVGFHSYLLGVWGEEKMTRVLKSWAVNTENVPLIEKDLDGVIQGVQSGKCLVGIANTYYFSRHLAASPNTKVKAVIPNVNDIGAHVNVDGVALLKNSKNSEQANAFAAWLLTEEAQLMLSDITGKHPANPAVRSEKLDKIFGQITENTTFDLNRITALKVRALEISTEQGLK